MKIEDNSAKVAFPPPLVFVGFLLLGFVIDRIAGLDGLPISRSLLIFAGAAFIGLGIALIFGAVGLFRRAGTPPEPWREVTAIVTTGIYRATRNPMYVGMAAVTLGLALVCNSIGALILLPLSIIAIQTQVISREENYMRGRFGDTYAAYCKQVRRWI